MILLPSYVLMVTQASTYAQHCLCLFVWFRVEQCDSDIGAGTASQPDGIVSNYCFLISMNIKHSVPSSRWLGWRHAVVHDVGRQATFAHRSGRVYYDAHADHLPVCRHAEYSLLVRKQKIPNLTTSLTSPLHKLFHGLLLQML